MINPTNGGKTSRFKLLKLHQSITSETLRKEIQRRIIPFELADAYLTQAFVLDRWNQRKSMAFAFSNSCASYEICIPYPTKGTSYKATIGSNAYTLIEGPDPQHVEVFKSFWDFLTWRTMLQQPMKHSAYILNGRKSLPAVLHEIISNRHRIKSVMDFLDNNDTGAMLSDQLAIAMDEIDMRYASQNYLYSRYKDLSDYWINDPDARLNWPIKGDEAAMCDITYQ